LSSDPPLSEPGTQKPAISGWQRSLVLSASRIAYLISRRWLFLFNSLVALYIALPFLAPVLMLQGAEGPARLIYKIYSPACHQQAHRSWFLFGEQAYYPFRSSGIAGVHYLEEYVAGLPGLEGLDPPNNYFSYTQELRDFYGNEQMGYKVALCQRDVALYLALLAGGLLFGLLRYRLGPLPWQLFLLFGILPMGLDGGYQLLTYLLPAFLPPRESTPLLRTVTGALMGLGLVWLTYPHIDAGMRETEVDLRRNLVRAGQMREE
jgi:uncharacterized membrane protein